MIRKSQIALIAFAVLTVTIAVAETRPAEPPAGKWQRAMALLADGDLRAIDLMQNAFADEQDTRTRQQIASTLVTLQVQDDRYYKYLVEFVREVVDRDMPSPMALSPSAQPTPATFSDEFIAWCTERDVDPQQAAHQAIYEDPAPLIYLGQTGDPRSFELLLEALETKNFFVAIQAATGLAAIGDARAIEPILKLSRRVPEGSRMFIAQALLQFDDPRATGEAAKMVPEELLPSLQQQVELDRRRRLETKALVAKLNGVSRP